MDLDTLNGYASWLARTGSSKRTCAVYKSAVGTMLRRGVDEHASEAPEHAMPKSEGSRTVYRAAWTRWRAYRAARDSGDAAEAITDAARTACAGARLSTKLSAGISLLHHRVVSASPTTWADVRKVLDAWDGAASVPGAYVQAWPWLRAAHARSLVLDELPEMGAASDDELDPLVVWAVHQALKCRPGTPWLWSWGDVELVLNEGTVSHRSRTGNVRLPAMPMLELAQRHGSETPFWECSPGKLIVVDREGWPLMPGTWEAATRAKPPELRSKLPQALLDRLNPPRIEAFDMTTLED